MPLGVWKPYYKILTAAFLCCSGKWNSIANTENGCMCTWSKIASQPKKRLVETAVQRVPSHRPEWASWPAFPTYLPQATKELDARIFASLALHKRPVGWVQWNLGWAGRQDAAAWVSSKQWQQQDQNSRQKVYSQLPKQNICSYKDIISSAVSPSRIPLLLT